MVVVVVLEAMAVALVTLVAMAAVAAAVVVVVVSISCSMSPPHPRRLTSFRILISSCSASWSLSVSFASLRMAGWDSWARQRGRFNVEDARGVDASAAG